MTFRHPNFRVPAAVLAFAFVASPAWAQFSGPGSGGEIYYNGGNVGIGTTSPVVPLHVAAPGGSTAMILGDNPYTTTDNTAGIGFQRWTDGSVFSDFKTVTGGRIYFRSGVGIEAGHTRFWMTVDPANGNVGLGTLNPSSNLQIHGTGNMLGLSSNVTSRLWNVGVSQSGNGDFLIDDTTGGFRRVTIQADTGNVGIGTTAPQHKLAVNGTIGAKEVIVTNSGWADYVFQSDYRLQPLSEVSAYIKQHRHLPEIPSEAEVLNKGISIGEMQAKLLAKIEELTLHMIRADEENQELKMRIAQLEAK